MLNFPNVQDIFFTIFDLIMGGIAGFLVFLIELLPTFNLPDQVATAVDEFVNAVGILLYFMPSMGLFVTLLIILVSIEMTILIFQAGFYLYDKLPFT